MQYSTVGFDLKPLGIAKACKGHNLFVSVFHTHWLTGGEV